VENSIALGATVALKLSELNTSGVATVTGIADAPRLKPGARCPVTGLMRRVSRDVLRLLLVGGAVLEVTSQHPLFSADRNDWVRAGELEVGEKLETRMGVVSVAQIEGSRKGDIEVFNLEVAREHRYFAGADRVLAHNTCGEEGTARVRHFTNSKGIKGIERDGVITASDQNSVFTVKAKGKPGSPRDVEEALGIKRGRGNHYVEFDAKAGEYQTIKNPRTGATETVFNGDVDLAGRNASFHKNR
jgi:hypothetical protein